MRMKRIGFFLVVICAWSSARAGTQGVTTDRAHTAPPSTIDGTQTSNSEGSSPSFMKADAKPATLYTAPGGVARTFASKWGDAVSLCDFETVCPSATDDTAAINAAIAALPSAGGKLYIPAGTFKFNAATITKSIDIECAGTGNVTTGLAGTKLTAFDASLPIFQFGNGTATSTRGIRLANCLLMGDGVNSTGDAIYLFSAYDVVLDNLAITSFGRDLIRIQCNTFPSSSIRMSRLALSGARGAAVRSESCAGAFTGNNTLVQSHINGFNTAGSYALYIDSSDIRMIGTYVDIGGDGVGHVKMVKSLGSNPLIYAGAATTFDQSTFGTTGLTLDVSTWLSAASLMSAAITGEYTLNGKVAYSDLTVNETATRFAAILQPWLGRPTVFSAIDMPLTEADAVSGNAVNFSRAGASGSNAEQLIVSGAAFKVNGADGSSGFRKPLQLGASALYKNTNGLLMWRKDSAFPGAENNAQVIGAIEVTPSTASTTVTIDASLGNIFDATYTTNAVHTIANPSGSGVATASHSQSLIDICTINTSGGALGVFTWGTNYRFANGGAQPATPAGTGGNCTAAGCRSCVQFRQDIGGALWRETWRSLGDEPN
jgi:hypothetical protein